MVTHGGVMGKVKISFEPRNSLLDFSKETSKISLLRLVKGFPKTKNMAIRGENLASLAALKAGAGVSGDKIAVDLIYIDPPYNVGGNQGYKNTWKGVSEKERDWAGDHGAFLDFMEPRLKICRTLLRDEGIIFVSICDEEYCRLKILLDEIFGESNNLGTFIWDKGRAASGSHMAVSHEYVLCYAKSKANAPALRQEKALANIMIDKSRELLKTNSFDKAQALFKKWVTEQKKAGNIKPGEAAYNEIHPENYRLFHADNSCAQDDPKGTRCRKALIHPITKKKCPVPKNGWKWKEETLDLLVEQGLIYFGKDHSVVPKRVRYLDENTSQLPLTVIFDGNEGSSWLPENVTFTTPKPVSMIEKLISLYPKNDITVLDFFAGSGATAHAVEELNQKDGGDRNWIVIEEMNSTFNLVMLERFKHYFIPGSYSIYDLQTATVQDKELMKVFSAYSKDFISAYHFLETDIEESEQGISVIGWDNRSKCIVAIVNNNQRSGKGSFEKELKLLKTKIKEKNAKKVLIYTINDGKIDIAEEHWRGVDKSIFHGTSCNELKVVEIPEQLIKEWNEVLQAMVA